MPRYSCRLRIVAVVLCSSALVRLMIFGRFDRSGIVRKGERPSGMSTQPQVERLSVHSILQFCAIYYPRWSRESCQLVVNQGLKLAQPACCPTILFHILISNGLMTPAEFIKKWKPVSLTERAAAHTHFLDLCELFEHEDPVSADPTGEWFTFEKGATKTGGGEG